MYLWKKNGIGLLGLDPDSVLKGSSSNGRAADSKSVGWGFESLLP